MAPALALLQEDLPRAPAPVAIPADVASVAKAIRILETFRASAPLRSPVLSIRQLADRTAIPRSTVHMLCRTLLNGGLLEQVPPRGYRLGPAVIELGGQVIDRVGLVDAAEGVIEALPRHPGTESHLGQLVGGWIVYLGRSVNEPGAPMDNRFGLRVPAHRTGCGRAALAWLEFEDAAARVLEVEAGQAAPSPPDMEDLRKELATIRQRGYAMSTTSQEGRLSVAAAVLDRAGGPVGGVSLAGAFGIFNRARLVTAADEVMLAAARISRRLAKHK